MPGNTLVSTLDQMSSTSASGSAIARKRSRVSVRPDEQHLGGIIYNAWQHSRVYVRPDEQHFGGRIGNCLEAVLALPGASCGSLGLPEASWGVLGGSLGLLVRPGAFWCLPGPPGASCGSLEPPGASWGLLGLPWAFWGLPGPPSAFWRLLGRPRAS